MKNNLKFNRVYTIHLNLQKCEIRREDAFCLDLVTQMLDGRIYFNSKKKLKKCILKNITFNYNDGFMDNNSFTILMGASENKYHYDIIKV